MPKLRHFDVASLLGLGLGFLVNDSEPKLVKRSQTYSTDHELGYPHQEMQHY